MFENRSEAGKLLGERLRESTLDDPVVLALPRGGVPVAAEVARILNAPLDVIVVRKLGVPFHPEYAMGAVGEADVRYIDWRTVSQVGLSASQVARVVTRERLDLDRRVRRFRTRHDRLDISGRFVIIVDDGVATGSTATAAIRVARDLGAKHVVLATPVAPLDTVDRLRRVADEVVVLETPHPFYAVGQAYYDFTQTTDDEVIATLDRMRSAPAREESSLVRSA